MFVLLSLAHQLRVCAIALHLITRIVSITFGPFWCLAASRGRSCRGFGAIVSVCCLCGRYGRPPVSLFVDVLELETARLKTAVSAAGPVAVSQGRHVCQLLAYVVSPEFGETCKLLVSI